MLPLTLANPGETYLIRKVGGQGETRKHLEDMGLVAGSSVTIVSKIGDNLIVNAKQSRIAISREMAQKIMV